MKFKPHRTFSHGLLLCSAAYTCVFAGAQCVFAQQPAAVSTASSKRDPEEAFRSGNSLMNQKKYCDALTQYKRGLESTSEDTSLLYNGGLAAYKCKQYGEALDLWSRLKVLDSDDWQTRAKLIQAYQGLGKLQERDAERAALFELRRRDPNGDLAKLTEYCRDQFEAGGEKIMVFEQFELKGDRVLRYVFSVLDETGEKEKYRLSLGSYETTNSVWRETTKPRPKEGERLFHLDGYYDWGHATYGMFSPEPTYDQVRSTVIEILEKKRNPVSTSMHGVKRN